MTGAVWVAVHHQHVASMPELALVSDAETRRERRALYELFLKPDTLCCGLIGDDLVGYALVRSRRHRMWIADTWVTGGVSPSWNHSVLPEHRGAGSARGSRRMPPRDRDARNRGRRGAPARQRWRAATSATATRPGSTSAASRGDERGPPPTRWRISRSHEAAGCASVPTGAADLTDRSSTAYS